ncbi:MAG: ABC transporter permease [Prevotellaceae bacterium]|jgi:putative ABC transport system permease protein|nr:ABC transporter permease [Prevotellaceae bacterium]
MKNIWYEIFLAMRTNKLRTILTGFSVAWGIFILIVLLASGNGLKNGVQKNFDYMAKNTVSIYAGTTSMPYNGLQSGRRLSFSPQDVDFFKHHFPNIIDYSPVYRSWNTNISFGKESVNTVIFGVEPGYKTLRTTKIKQGRFINEIDIAEQRKVIILHPNFVQTLFRDVEVTGQYVLVNDVPFQVAGVYEESSIFRTPPAYIPFNTAQAVFNSSKFIDEIAFNVTGVETKEESDKYRKELTRILSSRMQFSPEDQHAIWFNDRISSYRETQQIFSVISIFVWIIGIATLMAGIVGISNIMVITVKERTHEFGIRKALGATPASILKAVVLESLVITLMFGYIGMTLGVFITETASALMAKKPTGNSHEDMTVFVNPTVDINIVLGAMTVLVIAGIIAGYIPAKRAVSIKPIEALSFK